MTDPQQLLLVKAFHICFLIYLEQIELLDFYIYTLCCLSLATRYIQKSVFLSKNQALTLMFLLVRDKGALRLEDLAGSTTCRQYFKPSI